MLPSRPQILDAGQLDKPGLGWALMDGYPSLMRSKPGLIRRDILQQRGELKTAVVLEALRLLGEPGDRPWVRADLAFPVGCAPQACGAYAGAADSARGPKLSLAHSGSLLLAAAVGPHERVGVDVERLKTRDFARIGAHLGWSPVEGLVAASPIKIAEDLLFYRRWTLAESLYKTLGRVNLECFGELETLALGSQTERADASAQGDGALGLPWRSRTIGRRRWDVLWWQVNLHNEPAMACLLRATES